MKRATLLFLIFCRLAHAKSPPAEVILRQAFAEQSAGEHLKAIRHFKECIRTGPISSHLLLRYAHSLKEIGRPEEALARARQAHDLSQDLETTLTVAALYRNVPPDQEALSFLRKAREKYANEVALAFYLAEVLHADQQYNAARLEYLSVLALCKNNGWQSGVYRNIALWRLANRFFLEGRPERARHYLKLYLISNPDAHAARYFYAMRLLYDQGQYSQAYSEFDALLRSESEWIENDRMAPAEIFGRMGILCLFFADERAENFLERSIKLDKNRAAEHGYLFFIQKKYKESLETLTPLLKKNSRDPFLRLFVARALDSVSPEKDTLATEYRNAGRLFGITSQYDLALKHAKKALAAGHTDTSGIFFEMASYQGGMGQPRAAADLLSRALSQSSSVEFSIQCLVEQAGYLSRQGRFAEASQLLARAWALDQENKAKQAGQIEFARAKNYFSASQLPEALAAINRAMALKALPLYRFYRALFYQKAGETRNMLSDLQVLDQELPDSAEVANSLGYTLLEEGKDQEARPLLEKALEKEPDNPAFLDSMGWLKYRQGEYKAALSYLRLAEYFFEETNSFSLENSLHQADVLLAEQKYALARLKLDRALVSQQKFPSGQDAMLLDRIRQRLKLIAEKEGTDG